jgi:GNAT superfamily N-acetyltransferase
MEELTIDIRTLGEGDLALLECHLNFDWGQPNKHRQRFIKQQNGEVTYLVAWHDKLPVGHVLAKWAGTSDEPMGSVLKDCPNLEDLFVHPDYRSREIGAQLLDAGENLARQRGYTQIGLGVAIDNRRAQSLYIRRGYKDAGFGAYVTGGHYTDRQEKQQPWQEICSYLTLPL